MSQARGLTSLPESIASGAQTEDTGARNAPDTWSDFVESSDTAIIGRSVDDRIMSWNRGAERLYGYSAAEMIGRSAADLVPEERAAEWHAVMDRITQEGRIAEVDTIRVTRDGQRVHVSLLVIPTRDEDGTISGALTIARDITSQVEALEEARAGAQSRSLVLEAANRVALDILANRTGIEALKHIAEAARMLAGAQYAALGVARADRMGLLEFVTTGLGREEEEAIGDRPHGHGILGLLLTRTEPLRIGKLQDHPSSVGFPPNHPPMGSFLGVPIRRGSTVLGSLYLTNKIGAAAFTEADEVAVQALGAHAAVAIHHMHMLYRQRALVSGLMSAQEEERRSVAYDLHDGLTQYVMAAHAHLEGFRRARSTGKEEKAERDLDQSIRYLKEAVVESRRLVNGLRSLALDDLGLAGAVELLLNEEKQRAGWEDAGFVHNIAGQRFDRSVETAAYRVVQEALTNARKHAETSRIQVMLLYGEEPELGASILTVEVKDWGKGFEPDKMQQEYKHFGLQGMIERIHLIGGTHALQSEPGVGTIVRAVLPAAQAENEEVQQS
jgi:PAS domain S-box-containing protein